VAPTQAVRSHSRPAAISVIRDDERDRAVSGDPGRRWETDEDGNAPGERERPTSRPVEREDQRAPGAEARP